MGIGLARFGKGPDIQGEPEMNRRKNYYIKKEFQRNFILKFCAIVLAGSAISGVTIYLLSRATVTTSFENLRLGIKSTADYILPAVLLSSAVVIIATGIATIFITLFTSHKIAGPLYRIEKDIEDVASGNLRREFNLREGDEIRPIAEGLNAMVRFLKNEISALKKTAAELEALPAANDLPGEVKQKIKALKSGLDKFRT